MYRFILSVLYLAFVLIVVSFHDSSAAIQDRATKTVLLPNGLAVMLIHDPEVHRSAAALAVGVGSLYDPKDKMGLAHYLEHMLFLGTKKYPAVNSFDEFLGKHSGTNNAYTGSAVTNYFIQISHEAFEEGLDRFSRFFKEPLFDRHYSEREVHAVDSEHQKNKLRDSWRIEFAMSQISEKDHPIRKFGTGDKETLVGNNRAALLAFHKKYYVASHMKLAMLSNANLNTQEQYARRFFGEIHNQPTELPLIDPRYRKPLKNKYRLMKIKTIRDIHKLTLEFPTIRLADHLKAKPADIVGSVIGYEGKGSLLSKLKDEKLALGLSSGGGYDHHNINYFNIDIKLTEKGGKNYERVLDLIFAYLKMLKEKEFHAYTFEEIQTMAQTNFDWKDPDEGMRYVASIAALMHNYKLENVETLPYLYQSYQPELYMKILETLRPENMLAVLQSRSVETNKKSKFYGTEYSINEVGGIAFKKLRYPRPVSGLRYPEKNSFIPYNLTLLNEGTGLLHNDTLSKVWFTFDNYFKQPKVHIKFLIETPHVYDTVRNTALARLYELAVQEGLNEIAYPMQIGGIGYSLDIGKQGVVLSLGGYSEKINDLLSLVAKNLTRINVNNETFDDLKKSIIRRLKNRKLARAYSRAAYFNRLLWLVKEFNENELIKELEFITLDDLKTYSTKLYEKVFITGVIYGNWQKKQVYKNLDLLLSELKSVPLPEKDRYQEKVEVLKEREKILFSRQILNNNNALYYSLQVGEMSLSEHAAISMIASIVETDFYTQLRTNQQLGYVVWSFNDRIENRLFFKFVIQSADYGPFELKKRVELWLNRAIQLFNTLSIDEFEKHRRGLILTIEKKGESIEEVTEELFGFAIREKGNFEFKKQLIKTLKELKQQEVMATAKRIFLDPKTPRMVVLIRSQNNKELIPGKILTTVSEFKKKQNK